MTVETVLLDTNVLAAWLKPRSTLVHVYGKHVFGRRVAIAQQIVAEARYGALVAAWGPKRLDAVERLVRRASVLPWKQHAADLWIAPTALRWNLPLIAPDAVFIPLPVSFES